MLNRMVTAGCRVNAYPAYRIMLNCMLTAGWRVSAYPAYAVSALLFL